MTRRGSRQTQLMPKPGTIIERDRMRYKVASDGSWRCMIPRGSKKAKRNGLYLENTP